jgi:hypothetical protein
MCIITEARAYLHASVCISLPKWPQTSVQWCQLKRSLQKASFGQSGDAKMGIVDQMQSVNQCSSHIAWHAGMRLPMGLQAGVALSRGFPGSILQVCDGWPWSEDQHIAGISGLASSKPWWSGPSANSIDTMGYQGGPLQCAQSTKWNQIGR